MSYIVWDRHYLMTFRVFCVILAIVSAAGFLIATRILRDICHRDMTASKGHGVVR